MPELPIACLADAYSVVAALGCYLGLEAFSSEMTFPLYVLSLSLFLNFLTQEENV